jgi:hypothetical protein
MIETDWATQPAFHSWKLTRVDHPVTWEAGEPICVVLPQLRNELESWQPRCEDIFAHEGLSREYLTFTESRTRFNATRPREWQKDYFLGASPGNARAPRGSHQTKLRLRPFAPRSAADGTSNDIEKQ